MPNDGTIECADSYKHLSVIVVLNSVELLVDLMRFPGQLIPRSTKAIFMTHISAAGESDSAENDSCDSPLEPNSPLYGFAERVDPDRLADWLIKLENLKPVMPDVIDARPSLQINVVSLYSFFVVLKRTRAFSSTEDLTLPQM